MSGPPDQDYLKRTGGNSQTDIEGFIPPGAITVKEPIGYSTSIDEVIINHMDPGSRKIRRINPIHSLVGDRILEPGEAQPGETKSGETLGEDELLDKIFGRKQAPQDILVKKPRTMRLMLKRLAKQQTVRLALLSYQLTKQMLKPNQQTHMRV